MSQDRFVAVVPAFRNEATIGATVKALIESGSLDEVIVVDDGSPDETGIAALAAGARVVTAPNNLGKGAALELGFDATDASCVVMIDGDTGSSSSEVVKLIQPLIDGEADMTVGSLPPAGSGGGFGLVKRLAILLVARTSGLETTAPLSGQRALRREVFEKCRPLARGFGIDAALTADAARAGFRVVEVPVAMQHDEKGRGWAGFVHRGKQGTHLVRAFLPRLFR